MLFIRRRRRGEDNSDSDSNYFKLLPCTTTAD